MPAVGLNLEIDKALQDAAKLDRYLNKWVQDSVTFRENMSQAFNAKAGGDMAQYIQELRGVQSIIKDMSGKDLLSNADPKKMEQMHQAFDKIIASVDILSKAGATLFDTTGLYATTKGLGEATAEYQKLSGTVQKLISDYKTLDSVQGSKVTEKSKKEAQNLLLQRGYSDIQSKTDAELKAIAKGEQTKTELMLKAAVEAEAIAQKELNFAKMTQDEKAKYVQKRMDDILKAEQKNANEIRKQYSDLYRDLRSTVSSLGSYNSVLAEGKTLSAADQNKYQALQDQETKLRTQIEEMELKHLQYISDLRIRFATQDAKAAAEAYKNIQYSPQEALRMAANARTGNAKEQAKAAVQQALMNVDESDVKTIKALNDAYIKLRAGIESLTKAQKNEQTLQPTIRNEYARTLKELSTLEDAMRRLKNTDVYKNKSAAGHADAEAEFKAMEARYKDLEAKKLQLKQQSGALLAEVDRKHESDLAQAKLRTYEDAEKKKQEIAKKYATLSAADAQKAMSQYGNPENVRQAQLAIEKLAEVRDKLNNSDARYKDTVNDLNALMAKHKEYIDEVTRAKQQQSNVTPVTKDEAMNYSRNAKSAKELQDAIKKLEEARGREDLKTKQGRKNYTELTMELERQRKQYQRLSQQVQTSSRGMMNTADQLKRGFAMLFSVQQIRGYIRKMMEVRGEFELQHKSLEVLLQSKDKADELWNKTVALAVRSPFRVKDLVTYTKQLAAYRVESDKLYETNKMLADVSSGLGVDMGRLILAFGQVKAANFLRGTELRQFSEAGVNMLDELAKRFTNLEGRVVTVGEVFERVSKRMVSFKDVEAVFQTITSEGGVFYQMQEKQSETLKGMMMNLKDSVDLMLNDIGQSSEGLLKGAVERVKGFVDNWRHFVTVLQEVGVAILLIKIPAFVKMLGSLGSAAYNAAGSIQKVGLASTVMGTGLNRLTIGVKALSKALFSNPLFWGGAIVSAIAVATHRIIRHNKEVKETNKYYDELSQREVSRLGTLQETNKQVLEYNKKIKESQTALSSLKKGTKEYAQAENDLAVARKSNEELVNQLKRDYPTIAGLIKAQTDGTVDLNTAIEEQNRLLAARIALNEQAKGGFWHQDMKTNVGQAADALSEYRLSLDEVRNKAKAAGVELTNMYNEGRISKEDYTKMTELLASLSKVKDSKEAYSILAQLREFSLDKKLTESANTEYSNIQVFKDGLGDIYKSFNDARKNLQDTETSYASYLVDLYQNLDKMKAGFSEIVRVSKEASPDNWEEVAGKAITKELEQFNIVDSDLLVAVQQYIASQVLELPIKWTVTPKEYKEENLTGWKKKVWDALKEVNNSLGSELSEHKITVPLSDFFELPDTEIFKKLEEQVKGSVKGIDETIKSGLIPSQVRFSQAQLDAAEASKPLLKILSDLLGIVGKSSGSGKDYVMDKLKKRISLIKEMNSEYEKLTRTMSKVEAMEKVRSSFKDTARQIGLDISKYDFTDQGSIESLKKLLDSKTYKNNKYALEIRKALDNLEVELDIELREENQKKLFSKVQDMFDEYSLSLELKNMDVSPELAKKLGGVDYLDLKGLKKNVVKEFSGTSEEVKKILSKDFEDITAEEWIKVGDLTSKSEMEEVRKRLEEIKKMEDKELEDRFKKYVEYAKISIGERAKIKLEELRKLKEIEDTFKEKEGDDEETRQFKKDMAARAKANVKKESQDAMNKLDWENFEKSDTFVRIFEDLEGASVSMLNTSIKKLKEFRKQWQDMPLEDVTKIIKKVQELEDAMIKLKPGKMWTEGRNDFNKAYEEAKEDKNYFTSPKAKEQFEKGGKANFYKAVEEDTVHLEEQKAKAQEQISLLEVALRIKENTATAEEKLLAEETAYAGVLKMNKQQIQSQLDTEKGIVKTADKNLARNADIVNAKKKQNKALKQTGEYMEEAMGLANDLYGAFKELSVALGADEDSPAFIFADMGMSILSSIPNMLALIAQIQAATVAAQGLGTAMNMAMGIIGLIVMAVQIIAQVISAAVNYADQVKQNKIDVMAMQVENLEKAYERLAEAAEKAWSIEMMQKYSNELDKINEKAIAVQQNMVNAMADDKDVQEGIAAQRKLDAGMSLTNSEMKALLSDEYKEYKEAADRVAEMRKEHEEQKQKMLEDIGAVGDYHDATSEFVDAWVSAFQETGDGLSGLQENFREFFDDIIKQQASLRVTDKFLAPLYDNINKALDDYELTTEESAALRAQAEEIAPRLSEALEEIWNQLGGSKGESGSQLSGLQKGIQGVTEETAQVLESLLNSMRFYVADSNNEIKEQTRILRSINSALEDAFSNSPRAISVKMV